MPAPALLASPMTIVMSVVGLLFMMRDSKNAIKEKRELKQNQAQMLEQGRLQRESANPAIQEIKRREASGGPVNTLKYQQNKRDAELIIRNNVQRRARQAQEGDLSKGISESVNQSEKQSARKRTVSAIEQSQFKSRITDASKEPVGVISTSKQDALAATAENIDSAAKWINEQPIQFKPLQSAPISRDSINNDNIVEKSEFSSLRFANRRIIENKNSGLDDSQKAVVAAVAAMNENTIQANTRALQRKIARLDSKIEKFTSENQQTAESLNRNTQDALGQIDRKTTQNIKTVANAQGSSAKVVVQSTQSGINEMYGKLAEKEKENNIKTLSEINMGNASISDTIESGFDGIERTDADYRLKVEQQRMADLQWMEEGKLQDVSDRQMMMEQMEGLDNNQTSLFEKVKTVAANVNPEAMENRLNQAGGGLGGLIGKLLAFSAVFTTLTIAFLTGLPKMIGTKLSELFNAIKGKIKDLTLDALKAVFIKAPKKLLLSLLKLVPGMSGITAAYEKIFGKNPDRDENINKEKKSIFGKVMGLFKKGTAPGAETSTTFGEMSDMFKSQDGVGANEFNIPKYTGETYDIPTSEYLTTKPETSSVDDSKGVTPAVAAATGVFSAPIGFATKLFKRKEVVDASAKKEDIANIMKEGSENTNKQIGDVMGAVSDKLNILTAHVELISQKQDIYAEVGVLASMKPETSTAKRENPADEPSGN